MASDRVMPQEHAMRYSAIFRQHKSADIGPSVRPSVRHDSTRLVGHLFSLPSAAAPIRRKTATVLLKRRAKAKSHQNDKRLRFNSTVTL